MTEEGQAARGREAFSLLGHDVRLDILLALLEDWEAAHTEPRRYSDLMRAVGMQDSGKFNYHLDRLRGVYLRKVEGGYVPTASATALYRAVLAHRPTESPADRSLTPGVDCPDCGGDLVATYDRSFFTLRCPDCEAAVDGVTYPLPRNALDGRTDREVLAAVHDRARADLGLARRGQCPDCAGTTSVSVRADRIDDRAASDPADVGGHGGDGDRDGRSGGGSQPVEITCDTCRWTVWTGFLLPLSTDPRVASALVDRGVDPTDPDPTALPDPAVAALGTDPRTFEVTVETGDGSVAVVVDDDLDVREVS